MLERKLKRMQAFISLGVKQQAIQQVKWELINNFHGVIISTGIVVAI